MTPGKSWPNPMRRKALSFGAIGVINTAVDAATFALLLGAGLGPLLANALAWCTGASFSFAANSRLTFRSGPGRAAHRFGRFLAASAGASLLASTLIIWALADLIGIWPAKAAAITVGAVLGFLGAHWSLEGRLPERGRR